MSTPATTVYTFVVAPVPFTDTNAPFQELGVIRRFLLQGGLSVVGFETIDDYLTRLAPFLNYFTPSVPHVVGERPSSPYFGYDIV